MHQRLNHINHHKFHDLVLPVRDKRCHFSDITAVKQTEKGTLNVVIERFYLNVFYTKRFMLQS